MGLLKVLDFKDVFWTGQGYIVGAGIYSLLNITIKYGGNYTWLSFIIGGFICMMTGLSYADLSSQYSSSSAEYEYITESISKKMKHVVGFSLIILGLFTLATLMLAFTNYISKLSPNMSQQWILLVLIIVTSIVNSIGVKTTTNTNMVIAMTESTTLVLLILLSLYNYKSWKPNQITGGFDLSKINHGAFITIFTFMGFEAITRLSEETKDSKKTIPLAIVSALALSIVLYILVSISVNSILGTNNASKSITALADTFNKLLGKNSYYIVNVIGLFSIYNTVMLTHLFTSRQLYGISKDILPKNISDIFRNVNEKTKTPIYSIIFVGICGLLICQIKNVEKTTVFSNIIQFVLFSLINIAAILLRQDSKNKFFINYPDKLNKMPPHALIGLVASLYMLFNQFKFNYLNAAN